MWFHVDFFFHPKLHLKNFQSRAFPSRITFCSLWRALWVPGQFLNVADKCWSGRDTKQSCNFHVPAWNSRLWKFVTFDAAAFPKGSLWRGLAVRSTEPGIILVKLSFCQRPADRSNHKTVITWPGCHKLLFWLGSQAQRGSLPITCSTSICLNSCSFMNFELLKSLESENFWFSYMDRPDPPSAKQCPQKQPLRILKWTKSAGPKCNSCPGSPETIYGIVFPIKTEF